MDMKRIILSIFGLVILAVAANAQAAAPVLNPIGPRSVDEGQTLNFGITATDDDPPGYSLIYRSQ